MPGPIDGRLTQTPYYYCLHLGLDNTITSAKGNLSHSAIESYAASKTLRRSILLGLFFVRLEAGRPRQARKLVFLAGLRRSDDKFQTLPGTEA